MSNNSKVDVWEGKKEEFNDAHVVTEHPVPVPESEKSLVPTASDDKNQLVPIVNDPPPVPVVDGEPANYAAAVKGELHHENAEFDIQKVGNENLRSGNDEDLPQQNPNTRKLTNMNLENVVKDTKNIVEGVVKDTTNYAGDVVKNTTEYVREKVNDMVTGKVSDIVPPSTFDKVTKKVGDVVDLAVHAAGEAKDYLQGFDQKFKDSEKLDSLNEVDVLRKSSKELRELIEKASEASKKINDRLEVLERNLGIHNVYNEERRKDERKVKELLRSRKEYVPHTAVGEVCQSVAKYAVDNVIVSAADYAASMVVDSSVYVQHTIYNTIGIDVGKRVQQIDKFAVFTVQKITGIDLSTPVHLLERAIGLTSFSGHQE